MARAAKGAKKAKSARRARDPHPEEELASLARSLAGDLPRAVVLRGEERFFRDAGVRQVLAAAARLEYELCRHDASDPEFALPALLDDLTGGALFATARCVVVQSADQVLKKTAKRYSPGLQAALLARLADDAPGTLVLSAGALRADHVVVKAVKAAGGLVLGCRRLWETPPPWGDPDPRRAELVQWLVAAARERKVQLTPDEAAYVAAATGNDLYALVSQLDRLRGRGAAGVRELVGWDGGGTPWAIADHMASIDAPRSLAGIESLFSGGFHGKDGSRTVDTAGLSAMLTRALVGKLRELTSGAAVIERGGSPEQAAAAAGGPPAAKQAFAARVGTHAPVVWRAMLADACDLERRTRTWGVVDAADFYGLVLRWAKRHGARGRPRGRMPR